MSTIVTCGNPRAEFKDRCKKCLREDAPLLIVLNNESDFLFFRFTARNRQEHDATDESREAKNMLMLDTNKDESASTQRCRRKLFAQIHKAPAKSTLTSFNFEFLFLLHILRFYRCTSNDEYRHVHFDCLRSSF